MPKISFLFLIISSIFHEYYWTDFLKGHGNQYSIYIHSKEPIDNTSHFKKHAISQKIETTHYNTMRAQVELLRESLKDPDNRTYALN